MDRVTFLVEDHALPIGVFALMLPAGCLHDPPGLEGLAYLTGQLLLCGAGPMSQAEFADELDTIGSSLNAGTGRDALSLSGDALLRHVGDFQRLVASALVEPSLSASELARLKRRTLAELAQVRDNDSALGQRCFMEAAFSGHPYGRRLKGTEESIGRITRDDVVIEDGRSLDSLKRFKDDVREVRAGMECGLKIAGYDDIKEGDILEFYQQVEVARTL